jgi:hypothetical protein
MNLSDWMSWAAGQPGRSAAWDPHGILGPLILTLLLTGLIGYTYQKTHTGPYYLQGFVHTLVLVGMVASVVLRIVGDSMAAAFAIFGAFSIIRFRNAVPETRDVAFIFLSMVVGLAAGALQPELATVTTVVVCIVMAALWKFDLFAPDLTSHILRVRVTNDIDYSTVFRKPFEDHLERAIFISVETVQGGMLTEVAYGVRLLPASTPRDFVRSLEAVTGNNRILMIAVGQPEIGDRNSSNWGH